MGMEADIFHLSGRRGGERDEVNLLRPAKPPPSPHSIQYRILKWNTESEIALALPFQSPHLPIALEMDLSPIKIIASRAI
jgi:hypothetical protein